MRFVMSERKYILRYNFQAFEPNTTQNICLPAVGKKQCNGFVKKQLTCIFSSWITNPKYHPL